MTANRRRDAGRTIVTSERRDHRISAPAGEHPCQRDTRPEPRQGPEACLRDVANGVGVSLKDGIAGGESTQDQPTVGLGHTGAGHPWPESDGQSRQRRILGLVGIAAVLQQLESRRDVRRLVPRV